MSIELIKSNALQKTYDIQSKKQSNVNLNVKTPNTLERVSQTDTFEKKGMSTVGKIALGAVAITGALAMIDAIACKGKHIKKIFNNKQIGLDKAFDKVTKTEVFGYEDVLHIVKQKYKDGLVFDQLCLANPRATVDALKKANINFPDNPNILMLNLTKNGKSVHNELILPEKITESLKDLYSNWDKSTVFIQKVKH